MRRSLRLGVKDLTDLRARTAGNPTLNAMRDEPLMRNKSGKKYGNTKVVDGAYVFASKAEHKRFKHLYKLWVAGVIKDLVCQKSFVLIPAQVAPSGKKIRKTEYLADFVYQDSNGVMVVEDVKGYATPEYRLKKKLMLQVHGIEVREIMS